MLFVYVFINILEETEEKIFRFFLTFTVTNCMLNALSSNIFDVKKGTAQIQQSLANERHVYFCV